MNHPAEIIKALIKRGLTEEQIAERIRKRGVDVTQPTLNRIKTGVIAKPSFDVGAALLRLHDELTR